MHMEKLSRLWPVAALALALASTPVESKPQENWHEPYVGDKNVGGLLEQQYKTFLKGCNIELPLTLFESSALSLVKNLFVKSQELSSIPPDIQLSGFMDETVRFQQSYDIGSLFAHLYSDTEKTAGPVILSETSIYNNAAQQSGPEKYLIRGGDNVLHAETCASITAATGNISANASLSNNSLRAALASEYRKDRSQYIGMIGGDMASPWKPGLDANDRYLQQYLYVLLWQWYASHPDKVGTNLSILKEFKGVSVLRILSNQTSASQKSSLELSAKVAAASTDGTFSSDSKAESLVRIENNATYILPRVQSPGKPDTSPFGDFFAAPAPEIIANIILNSKPDKAKAEILLIAPETENLHTQFVHGIPSYLCADPGLWEPVITPPAAGTGSFVKKLEIVDTQPGWPAGSSAPVCSFHMSMTPAPGISGALTLNYQLKLKSPIPVGDQHKNQNLMFQTDPITFDTSEPPSVNVYEPLRRPEIISTTNESKATWNFDVIYTERPNNPVDASTAPTGEVTGLTCNGVKVNRPFSVSPAYKTITKGNTITKALALSFESDFPKGDPTGEIDNNSRVSVCEMDFLLHFAMQGAKKSMDRSLPRVIVHIPVPTPKPVADTAPAPAISAASPAGGTQAPVVPAAPTPATPVAPALVPPVAINAAQTPAIPAPPTVK